MQVISLKIIDDAAKDDITRIIADKYCRMILENTASQSKSALIISHKTKIPVSTVYRKLRLLENAKMIRMSGDISNCGKNTFSIKAE